MLSAVPDSPLDLGQLIHDHGAILPEPDFEKIARAVMKTALEDVQAAVSLGAALVVAAGERAAHRVLALVAAANARAYAGDLHEAVQMLGEAEGVCVREGLEERRALVAGAMVQPLLRLGRADEAAAAATRAVNAAPTPLEEAKACVSLGAVLRLLGRREEAVAVLERAELLAGDGTAVAAAAMSNRAECLLDADRFEDALEVFRRAAAGFEACGRAHASAIVRGNIADVLGRLGRVDEATQAFEDARRAFELTGATLDIARLDGEEAEMLVQAGALRMARDRYAHAVPILERASAAAELSRARAAFGLVLVRLGDARSARQVLEQTASESFGLDIPGLEAEVGIALAVCDLLENKPDNATRRTDAILADPDLASSRRARVLLTRAESALSVGDRGTAARHAHAAAELARNAGLGSLIPLCLDAESRAADGADARSLRVIASEQARGVLGAARSDAGRGGLARLYAPLLARAATDAIDGPDAWQAIDLLEVATPTQDAAHSDERSERIEAALSRAYGRAGALGFGVDEEISTLEREAQIRRDRAVAQRPSGQAESRIDGEHVRQCIPSHGRLVRFFADADVVHAVAATSAGTVGVRDVASLSALESLGRRATFLAERAAAGDSSVSEAWRGVVRRLHRSLLLPVLDRQDRRLVVVVPAELAGLPWNAMAVLGDHPVDLSIVPGVTGCATPLERRRTPVVVAACPVDPSLATAPEECAGVAAAWGGTPCIGATADETLARVRGADIVHLATHGVFVPDRPGSSRLQFQDRWVTVRELCRTVGPGALVLLSACHAGRSGGLAEDRASVPSSLLAAGAGGVIAPVWPLSDARATEFSVALHRGLRSAWSEQAPASVISRVFRESVRDAASNTAGGIDAAGMVLWGGFGC